MRYLELIGNEKNSYIFKLINILFGHKIFIGNFSWLTIEINTITRFLSPKHDIIKLLKYSEIASMLVYASDLLFRLLI